MDIHEKTETIRHKLIEVAKKGDTITYKEVASLVELLPRSKKFIQILGDISMNEYKESGTLLSAVVVLSSKSSNSPEKKPGEGFYRFASDLDLGIDEPKTEEEKKKFYSEQLDKVHSYWKQSNDNSQPAKSIADNLYLEEDLPESNMFEGSKRQITINQYERNPQARQQCINHYGTSCSVCDMDFSEKYGEIGEGFIHVHHLIPLSECNEGYEINPINDLRPVCPNCHAMLHRKKPVYTINELKEIIKR